jgi:hypothetical protein
MGEVTNCGLCGSPYMVPILDMGIQPLAEQYGNGPTYPLRLVRCRSCTLVQLDYIVPATDLFASDHPYAAGNSAERRRHAQELAGLIHTRADDTVVDIGANDGTSLAAFGGRCRLIAVEPTDQARKIGPPVIVYQKFFTSGLASRIRDTYGPAQIVTAYNVLAHVPDPHDFMQGVATLLSGGGTFVTENHDLSAVMSGLQIDTVYHEHLRYYDLVTLGRLLSDHGFTVWSSQQIPAHGGSFRVRAGRMDTGLQHRADMVKDRLTALLRMLTDGGAPVYGVGAATRATPLMHFTGADKFLTCVCEIAGSEKIGKMMPGTQIPIVDEKKLIEDQPPYALLFAWHIAPDVMSSLRAAGYTGKFIIPLPQPRIVSD